MISRSLFPVFILAVFSLGAFVEKDRLIWTENFESASANWRQSNNADETFLIQNGRYLLWRKDSRSPSLILPEDGDLYAESLIELSVYLEKSGRGSSAGLVALAQQDGSGAYVLEINSSQEFRVRKIANSLFVELSGSPKNHGWTGEKGIRRQGMENRLGCMVEDGNIRFFINGKEVYATEEPLLKKGKCGVMIGPASKAEMDDLQVFVSEEEARRIKEDRNADDPARSALTEVIITLRNTINSQNRELDSLRKLSSRLNAEIIKYDQSPKNVKKLEGEIASLKKGNTSLQAKIKKLEKENAELQLFRQSVQRAQGGDMIIKLSMALADEKEKNTSLKKELDELKMKLSQTEQHQEEKQ
jgi:cell division protein FtsB